VTPQVETRMMVPPIKSFLLSLRASQISGGEWDVMRAHFAQDLPAPTTSERIAVEDAFANCKE
jgi:hypothetical protein